MSAEKTDDSAQANEADGVLAGKIAVVTGASRGIGRAIATILAGAGAKVAGCARHAVDEIIACDVGRPAEVERFAAEVLRRFGPPDLLVNNAGLVARAHLDETSLENWDAVLDSNLKGTFLVTRAFLPAMRTRRSGRIVNIASISGRQGTAGLTAYCAAKHGVVGLTRALAEELRPDGIAVNAVCPGSVDTDMLRVGMPGARPAMSPEDVANVVIYLAAYAPPALTGSCVDVFG
jgi:NAD(P)-dependent dehydrogenase (short-subunit alcohol dehydrogenase family)